MRIALYQPDVAVVTNISLDHKSLAELHSLFGDFAAKARVAVVNADDPESAPLLAGGNVLRFGFSESAAMRGSEQGQSMRAEIAEEMTARQIAEAQRQARALIAPRDATRAETIAEEGIDGIAA